MAVLDPVKKSLVKVFGSRNERLIKSYRKRVQQINDCEPQIRPLTDAQLKQRAQELRRQIADGQVLPRDAQAEAFALMRESIDRNVGIRNIFNPELEFDPARLPSDEARQAYQQVRQQIDQTPDAPVLGADVAVPAWLTVEIPNVLHEAVRQMQPESRPPFRARPFDVQLIGGMVLHEGKIAEMKTGEGKTIVAPLACFMAALEGLQCYVVTVNDYLVQRDRDWVFPAFHALGMTVGAIHSYHLQPPEAKQRAYECDVVYGTNSEFGFDYLRDNMKLSVAEQVQKNRDFCIVDEIDSILIDEARTPLIISGPAHDDAPQYQQANQVAEQLVQRQKAANQETRQRLNQPGFVEQQAKKLRANPAAIQKIVAKFRDLGPDYIEEKEAEQIDHLQYYVVKPEQKQASMTHEGVEEAQKIVGTRFYVVGNDMAWDHLINQAVRAHTVYEKDRDYVVKDGEVVIVDEFTGRLMVGRQWSDGLHQAVEAKESKHGVQIKKETQTLATVTIQNFFKLFKRLAGMTGTAVTEAGEFMEIYGLDVAAIPTNKPVIRADHDDLIFLTQEAKWNAIIEEIKEVSEAGQPVLVGTTSVEKSQYLSDLLTRKYGVDHEVLNAKQHEREAHIVAKAGHQHVDNRSRTVGNVTISTNMAGRGTDIRLPQEVLDAGGLHIVGTERHESRRIDNQLRGRAGRQGDPGSSRFFISMEDDLMKMFAGKSTMKALSMLGMKEDEAIEHRWITRSVERAQRKVEERNFQIRKNLLEYDEVMEYQRGYFYGRRQKVLDGDGIGEIVFDYIAESIEDACARYLDPLFVPEQVAATVRQIIGVTVDPQRLKGKELADIDNRVRYDAKSELRAEIETSLEEYVSHDIPPEDWDAKGLSQWAMSRFGVDLKQSQIRQSAPEEIGSRLSEAAFEQVDRKSLDPLADFFEPGYAEGELAAWAQRKFGIEFNVDDLKPQRNERPADQQQRVAERMYQEVREAYERREIVYPVDFVLETAFGIAQQGADAGAWAADQLARWANHRFDLGWTAESVRAMTGDQLREQLIEAAEEWHGPKLEQWLDQAAAHDSDEAIAEAFQQRWGVAFDPDRYEEADNPRDAMEMQARAILRTELTQLERYVLLQILDQTWKDHLYAMDQLKDSIGLRGYGEKDPKIEYKREGARIFQEMQQTVRDKVSDLIFRAKLTANAQMRSAYSQQAEAHHQKRQGTGVAAAAAAQPATDEQRADLEAAQRAGAEKQVAQTIVNRERKVGRNDPCPCGSGKKYKQCCGRHA